LLALFVCWCVCAVYFQSECTPSPPVLVRKRKRNKVTVKTNERLVVSNKEPLMYQLTTMTTCDSPRLCCTHNTRNMSDPNNTKPIGTLRGSLSGIDMVEILQVCLGMFQVSFVDGSTTDLVVCQTNMISVLGERRGAEWNWRELETRSAI